jgi:hypothetical protein
LRNFMKDLLVISRTKTKDHNRGHFTEKNDW